jgi:phytoene dehydrogenase-like protein
MICKLQGIFLKKKNKKKIIIVGAGITGLYAAITLSESGHNVSVYETQNKAGGILRDIEFKGNIFYRACQFLNADSKWFKNVEKLSNNDFYVFEANYGSYNENEIEAVYAKNFSTPIFNYIKIKPQKNLNNLKKIKTLYQRIDQYDENIKSFLLNYSKNLNIDINNISEICSKNLQINRVGSLSQKNL